MSKITVASLIDSPPSHKTIRSECRSYLPMLAKGVSAPSLAGAVAAESDVVKDESKAEDPYPKKPSKDVEHKFPIDVWVRESIFSLL
ncbi:hypothetical protein MVEG_01187 [Podila verticillata NRRL 6337]|nr:hypothetical protein MVEG_01187 [Podila verticillata NRRL 6337]